MHGKLARVFVLQPLQSGESTSSVDRILREGFWTARPCFGAAKDDAEFEEKERETDVAIEVEVRFAIANGAEVEVESRGRIGSRERRVEPPPPKVVRLVDFRDRPARGPGLKKV